MSNVQGGSILLYIPEDDLSIILLSNISSDFEKIETEFKAIAESLRETTPNEKERNQIAMHTISEKYPDTRGFERMMKEVHGLFFDTRNP